MFSNISFSKDISTLLKHSSSIYISLGLNNAWARLILFLSPLLKFSPSSSKTVFILYFLSLNNFF